MPSKNMIRKGKRRQSVKAEYRVARDAVNDAQTVELAVAEAQIYGEDAEAAALAARPAAPNTAVPDRPRRGYQKSGRRQQRPLTQPETAPVSEMDEDDELLVPEPAQMPLGARKSWVADPDARGQRLDLHLAKMLPEISRARAQLLIDHGQVQVNGVVGKSKGKLQGGETIVVEGDPQPTPLRAHAEDIPLSVVYEDKHMAVIDKPAGMMVHAGSGLTDDSRSSGTLVNALLHYFKDDLSEVGGPLRPGIVHRLDKQTSGLIMVAKNDQAHRALAEMFSERTLEKRYIALVHRAVPIGRRPFRRGGLMTAFLFTNGLVLDPRWDSPRAGLEVLVEDGVIREVSESGKAGSAQRIDLGGRVLMPGLIDAHVHVVAAMANLAENGVQPSSLAAFRTAEVMRGMLMRGFTTVRDMAGADYGLVEAQRLGLLEGPRLVICGKALSQTGGHSDTRQRGDDRAPLEGRVGVMGRLVDGVDAVRRATREELRAGADFIKLMANGGVASPTDPIHMLQFSRDEMIAAVEEATNSGTYVSVHVYTDAAIRRAVECGAHSLEHCNLIEAETAALAASKGCWAVPTLITYDRLATDGARFGLGPDSVAKIETVRQGGLRSLATMRDAGLRMAYGSDLLGPMHEHQSGEFAIRAQVLPAIEVLRSATTYAAELLRMTGKAGIVEPGAYADLLVVDGDPLTDWSLLEGQGAHIPAIMQAGRFVKNTLH